METTSLHQKVAIVCKQRGSSIMFAFPKQRHVFLYMWIKFHYNVYICIYLHTMSHLHNKVGKKLCQNYKPVTQQSCWCSKDSSTLRTKRLSIHAHFRIRTLHSYLSIDWIQQYNYHIFIQCWVCTSKDKGFKILAIPWANIYESIQWRQLLATQRWQRGSSFMCASVRNQCLHLRYASVIRLFFLIERL